MFLPNQFQKVTFQARSFRNIYAGIAVLFLVVSLIFGFGSTLPAYASNTTYYVSTSGNDTNSGKSDTTPFKSISKINSLNLGPGDRVLFKCGDTWNDQSLVISKSGNSTSPLVFSSYPSTSCANKPVFNGSRTIGGWTNTGSSNIYVADLTSGQNNGLFPNGINQLFQNDARLQLSRWPNINASNGGYAKISAQNGSQITIPTMPNSSWANASAHVRGMTWYIENHKIISANPAGHTITLDNAPNCFDGGCAVNGGWGMWIDNSLSAIDQNGEWAYDTSSHKVYIKSDSGIPTNIEGSVVERTDSRSFGGVNLGQDSQSPVSYITFKNFLIKNWYQNGVSAPTNLSGTENHNVTISNTIVKNPASRGFSFFTWVYNANDGRPDGWRGGYNLTISHNIVDGANTEGIYTASRDSVYESNLLQNIALLKNTSSFGLGCGDTSQGFLGTDCTEDGTGVMVNKQNNDSGRNNQFKQNRLSNIGAGGFVDYGPNNSYIQNVIQNFGATKADVVGLRMYGTSNTTAHVTQNVIQNGLGNLNGTDSTWDGFRTSRGGWAWAIHSDAGASGTLITNNTISNMTGMGIVVDGPGVQITGNTIFNAKRTGISVSGNLNSPVNTNIVFQNGPTSTGYHIYELNQKTNVTASNNYLFNPYANNSFTYGNGDQTFAKWKSDSGQDTNSKTNWYTQTVGQTPKAQIFINTTSQPTTVNLIGTYQNLDQQNVTNAITLAPYTSQILVKV